MNRFGALFWCAAAIPRGDVAIVSNPPRRRRARRPRTNYLEMLIPEEMDRLLES
jgi:hypothetical protein